MMSQRCCGGLREGEEGRPVLKTAARPPQSRLGRSDRRAATLPIFSVEGSQNGNCYQGHFVT